MCNKTRKSFGELIDHFILGGNATNLIANADGVGKKGKKRNWPIVKDQSPCTTLELLQGTKAPLFSY